MATKKRIAWRASPDEKESRWQSVENNTMEMYGTKDNSLPQKLIVMILQLLLLGIAYSILFGTGAATLEKTLGWPSHSPIPGRRYVVMGFSIIVFFRMTFTMLFLMQRRLPWSEAMTLPFAFALYYIGFAVLVLPYNAPLGPVDYFGITIFLVGSLLNTVSEIQRKTFKSRPENKGRLYTNGLFSWSMHINFFGDIMWVAAYAIVSRNPWSVVIVIFLVSLFVFYNVPKLDKYLAEKYGPDFEEYATRTKRLFPWIW